MTDFELLSIGIFLGVVTAMFFIGIGVIVEDVRHYFADKSTTETRQFRDNDADSVLCRRHCDRSGDQSDYLGLDDEAVKGILYVMRMSVRYSEAERLAIDYCIDRLEAKNG